MVALEFQVLGPVGVRRDGVEVELDGAKPRTLLAALLLARGRAVSTFRLREVLWGDDPPATYPAQIYNYVSRLRKRLDPHALIVRRWSGYVLDVRDGQLDLDRFEHQVALAEQAGRAHRITEAAERLRAALAWWPGPVLTNVTEELARAEAGRMAELRLAALDRLMAIDLALGRHGSLVPELTRLVAERPLFEGLRAQLMIALDRSGRPGDALAVYHEGRRILAEELGLDPGRVLTDAYRQLLTRSPVPAPV
jgi:DNA-binding SARP family transcriptional activator